MPGDEPYAIRLDLTQPAAIFVFAARVLFICQLASLVTNLFKNAGSIKKVLRPIQELAATASRLSSMTHMSRQELEALAGELEKINAKHLDSRIDLPATQKELRSLAQSINAMLERINRAYSAQARFVSDASHELRTPIAVIQGYAALLDRWGKDDPEALQESISAIRSEAKSMEELVEQLLFLARGDNDTQPVKPSLFDLSALAGEVLRGYASLRAETDVMRCKLCALLLPTYKLSGDEEAFVRLHDTMRGLLPVVKAPQSRALLLVTLYGCTDNALYRRMAHELVDPWQVDPSPKKSKLSLIHRLGDYDRWLGHESVDS